ncbi:MAG: cob(I)yrinic acid a,c-diamide adenosyltransferase [Candidatus Thorarchaeota archaeon]
MKNITLISGGGKGKTTSAFGYLLTQINKGRNVIIVQFLKTGNNCGECNFLKNNEKTSFIFIGKTSFYVPNERKNEYIELIRAGLSILRDKLKVEKTDILLLDELCLALSYDLVKWEEIQQFFAYVNDEIIITGRNAPTIVEEETDTLILVEEKKHPFTKGLEARRGIEY